jgi:hypothetical protein
MITEAMKNTSDFILNEISHTLYMSNLALSRLARLPEGKLRESLSSEAVTQLVVLNHLILQCGLRESVLAVISKNAGSESLAALHQTIKLCDDFSVESMHTDSASQPKCDVSQGLFDKLMKTQ